MKRRSGKKGGATRVALIILCVFLALTLVALIAGTVYLESMMNLMGRVDSDTQSTMSSSEEQEYLDSLTDPTELTDASDSTEESVEDLPTMDPTDVTWATSTDPVVQTENIINILIIGQDARSGQGRQRSDSMILCTVNKSKKTLTLTSFMRDLYVQIPASRITASTPAMLWAA